MNKCDEHIINDEIISIKERLNSYDVISECAKNIINNEDYSNSLNYAVLKTLSYYDADRAYLFKYDSDKDIWQNTYELCSDGVKPQIEKLQNVPSSSMEYWIKLFNTNQAVIINDVRKLKNIYDRKEEYKLLRMQDVNCMIAVPILYNKKIIGFFGVDNPKLHKNDRNFLDSIAYIITSEDVKNKLKKDLYSSSYYDSLTGLLNYSGFIKETKALLDTTSNNYAIIVLDILQFKGINKLYGYEVGNEIIKNFIDKIVKNVLDITIVGRISVDEFLILVDCDKNDLTLNEKSNGFINVYGIDIHVRFRSGIYKIVDKKENVENMADKALLALESTSESIHNNCAIYNKLIEENVLQKTITTLDFKKALNDNEFIVYYQPVYDTFTKKIAFAEALIRWNKKDFGLVYPNYFISTLEDTGEIVELDYYVLKHCSDFGIKRMKEHKHWVPMSVNFSRVSFIDNVNLKKAILGALQYKSNERCINIEITESCCSIRTEETDNCLRKLQELDTKIYLDDFGSGYSTLKAITDYNFDVLKIDMSLIKEICQSNKAKILVENIINMSHQLNLKVVAEGVEDEKTYNLLKEYSCDYIQGYYFSKPVSEEEFIKLLDNE